MGVERADYRTLHTPVSSGATLVGYTDGLVERRGESLDAGLTRLADAALSGPTGAKELCEHVLRRLLPAEGRLLDDVTAVVVRLL